MKRLFLLLFALHTGQVMAQQSTIDIPGMHQLIDQSKSEYTKQTDARTKQATVTANEQANLTLLTKMKNLYRTLQQRYNTLGTAIEVANIGLYATPMLRKIVADQSAIVSLVRDRPELALLGYRTEIEFVGQAEALTGYITGLTLSIGDVNQIRPSDRKLLFDYVLQELSRLQELSGSLVNTLTYFNLSATLRSLNPFQGFIDQDKDLVKKILENAKYLRQ